MCAFTDLPEFKALSSFFGYERTPAVAVDMPLADIACFVTGLAVNLAHSRRIGIQGLIVIKEAVR